MQVYGLVDDLLVMQRLALFGLDDVALVGDRILFFVDLLILFLLVERKHALGDDFLEPRGIQRFHVESEFAAELLLRPDVTRIEAEAVDNLLAPVLIISYSVIAQMYTYKCLTLDTGTRNDH